MNVYEKITSLIDHVQNEGLNGFKSKENRDVGWTKTSYYDKLDNIVK